MTMRMMLAGFGLAAMAMAMTTATAAAADDYRYCAVYGVEGRATNCYFVTLEQCQAAISGMGGFCQPNPYYTGDAATPRRAKRRP